MDVRINTHTVSNWKEELVGNGNARFIWLDSKNSPIRPAPDPLQEIDTEACTVVLAVENTYLWLADENDIVITDQFPSEAFVAYVKKIRSFVPAVWVLTGADPTFGTTQRILDSSTALSRLLTFKERGTYLFPSRINEGIELLSKTSGIPLAGTLKHQTYDTLNNKGVGRKLCMHADIRCPTGVECNTVGELRTALCSASHPTFPLLAKEADEDSGEGHTLMASQRDADLFLKRFENETDNKAVTYVVESFLHVPPESNLNFRLFVGRTGKTTLTDIHRSWVYPPDFYAYRTESVHAFDVSVVKEIHLAAEKLGAVMFKHGFLGSAGVDGVIDSAGTVYPALDINPRLTGDVWMTNLVRQFNSPFFGMEMHVIEKAPIGVDFTHIQTALHQFSLPSEGKSGVVVLYVKRKTSLAAQMAGLQTLRIKTFTVGTSIQDLRALTNAVRDVFQTFTSDNDVTFPVNVQLLS